MSNLSDEELTARQGGSDGPTTGSEVALRQEAQGFELEHSAMTIEGLVSQTRLIQEAMKEVMKDGEHYGTIPGTPRPTLLKPGAEKLCLLFRLDPEYDVEKEWANEHVIVTVKCTLFHSPTRTRIASGIGLCTTLEAKYAWRDSQITCPACGKEAVIKGKKEYGGGWLCWKKKGGCGEKFADNDPAIVSQDVGKVPNEALPDTYNTVIKMACKRSLVAAVLNATAASDIFTQDLEDMPPANDKPVIAYESASTEEVNALRLLLAALAEIAPQYWEEDVVVKNSEIRFARQISDLSELTSDEVHAIVEGAKSWAEKHDEAQQAQAASEESAVNTEPVSEESTVENEAVEGEVVEES